MGRTFGIALGLALVVWVALEWMAGSPFARLNVMQIAALVFFLTVIARQGMASEPPAELGLARAAAPAIAQAETRWGLPLALALAAIVYATAAGHYFVADDFAHLWRTRAPLGETLWSLLAESPGSVFPRTVGLASLLLDSRLFGLWPAGYHLENLLLHLATVAGVYLLCRNLELTRDAASGAALVFAVLPVHPESVAWMTGRLAVLAAALTVWSVVFYLRYRVAGAPGGYWAALALFFLGMFTYETAFMLPGLVLALEFLALPERRLKPALGFIALAAAVVVYRWSVLGQIGSYPVAGGEVSAFEVGLAALQGLLIRAPAMTLLGYNWLQPEAAWGALAAALAAGLLLTLAFTARPQPQRSGVFWFALAWVVLGNLPAHLFLLIGPGLTNSRALYLGAVGIALLVGMQLGGIGGRWRRWGLGLALGVVLAAGVFYNLRAWHWAGEVSRRMREEMRQMVPDPAQKAEFVFRGMPGVTRGVPLFTAGLPQAVRLAYDRDDLTARRAEERPARDIERGQAIVFNWVESEERVLGLLLDSGRFEPGPEAEGGMDEGYGAPPPAEEKKPPTAAPPPRGGRRK